MLVYAPNENFNGIDTMVYQVMDSGTTSGQSDPRMDSALVVVLVNPLNDAPTIAEISDQEIDEDTTLRLAIESSDIDGDNTQVHAHLDDESSGLPVELFVFDDGDSLLIVPGLNWNGSAVINVVVSDGLEDAVATFNLLVNPVDDDPFMTGYLEDIYFYEDFEDVWMADLNELFEDIDGAQGILQLHLIMNW